MVTELGLTPEPKFSAAVLHNDLHQQIKPAPMTLGTYRNTQFVQSPFYRWELIEIPSSCRAHFTDGETKALKARLISTAGKKQQ